MACETGDRRGALALGLGFATTGALTNHGTQTHEKSLQLGGCCDHRENPRTLTGRRIEGGVGCRHPLEARLSPLALGPPENDRSFVEAAV